MGATFDILAPADQTEGTRSQVLRWLKGIGEPVAEAEPLIEIETDKVTVEVPSPASGVLREIVKGEQEEIEPGELLGRLEAADAAAAGASAAASSADPARPRAAADASTEPARPRAAAAASTEPARPRAADVAAGAGASPSAEAGASFAADTHARSAASADIGASAAAGISASPSADTRALPSTEGGSLPTQGSSLLTQGSSLPTHGSTSQVAQPVSSGAAPALRLSPAVRRLIAERGLDPSVIRGTGEGGRITVDDVLAHPAPARTAGAPLPNDRRPEAGPTSAPQLGGDRLGGDRRMGAEPARRESRRESTGADSGTRPSREARDIKSRFVPHSTIRKRIAGHMVQSLLQTAPHVTTVFRADMSAVMAHRSAHRSSFEAQNVPLTYTAYFLAAAVQAIRAVPEANSRWTDAGLEIYDEIHIGVATAIEGTGLVVPVLRNVESRDLESIARELNRLVTAARDGGLSPADVRDGTFTISNHGVSGSLLAAPIVINQPQSAILGIGKLEKRPVVVEKGEEERIVVRPECYVTLTIDHRVMDGHQANRFLQTFVRTLESWPAR